MTKKEVWLLDDARYTVTRVGGWFTQRAPDVAFRAFPSRFEMESAWQNGQRPSAIILDLLVPDFRDVPSWQHMTVSLIVMRNASGWRGLKARVVSIPLLWVLKPFLPRIVRVFGNGNVRGLGRLTCWGGLAFLNARRINGDLKVPVYVYSIAANEEYRRRDYVFRPICEEIMLGLEQLREETPLRDLVRVFAKGFFSSPLADSFVHDEFDSLFDMIKLDLGIA